MKYLFDYLVIALLGYLISVTGDHLLGLPVNHGATFVASFVIAVPLILLIVLIEET